ncbi:MAG TPA: adenylate kinase [Armatimonadota bacterium]|nr:adenylate kinase [Armatimonadota bacterium]HOJ20548.1 adenylate kinase [Armatimonadota bacterium]HOM81471.1 adenylate kinase [Armatimonadota bacterium]HOQ28600.1 adenylate kinase [Armatimonadota bacterium]HPO72771.1 adenylate kinase [Armatimonadota bacterium]
MRLVLLGAPGAGKGTLAKQLSKALGVVHISTGDIFREEVAAGTELGKKAKSYMDRGALVPDEVVIGMVKQRLSRPDVNAGFILDGFPRTVPQAEALDKVLEESNQPLDAVLDIVVPEETVVRRLSGRRVCRQCGAIYHIDNMPTKQEGVCDKCGGEVYQRDDDQPEAIRQRLKVYAEATAPLTDYYRTKGLLRPVDGTGTPEEVLGTALALLKG